MARPRKDKSETPAPAAPVTEAETTTDQAADAGTTTAATEPAATEPTTSTPAATIEPKPSKAKESKRKADPVPRTTRAFNKGDALALFKAREAKPYAHGAIEAAGRNADGVIVDIRPDGHSGAVLSAVPVFDALNHEQREQVADSGLMLWAECLPKS